MTLRSYRITFFSIVVYILCLVFVLLLISLLLNLRMQGTFKLQWQWNEHVNCSWSKVQNKVCTEV